MMRVLVFGAHGQLGWQFMQDFPEAIGLCREQVNAGLDSVEGQMIQLLDRYQPDVIFNAIAYTAVDRAEQEPELAFRVNAAFPALLAKHAGDARLVHFSSDYVFDGKIKGAYRETDATAPLSVYGASKRAGELAVLEHKPDTMVLRSTWLVSQHGHNFAKAILRLACTKSQLRVVADQVGVPTPTPFLSAQIKMALHASPNCPQGLYHLVPEGETNWHAYAKHIVQRAMQHPRWNDRLMLNENAIEAITAEHYPLPAVRPLNSRLDCERWKDALGLKRLPHYQTMLDDVLDRVLALEPFPAQTN